MEQNKYSSGNYYTRPNSNTPVPASSSSDAGSNTFSTAALVLGIIALLSFFSFTMITPVIFGSLSIILALLSRGSSPKMHSNSKTGITLSICAIIVNIASFALVFGLIFNNFEAVYGMSYQEMMEAMENGTLDYNEMYENISNNLQDILSEEFTPETSGETYSTPRSFEEIYPEIYE